ncbi:MAG: response regulator [Acidobacteria bacterium]|jgi:DNA-binding response OmpR family regulator|nr:response regulator [Acidobacteriota bacterium]
MKKKKILVIDDEEFIRDLVKEFLATEDHYCDAAKDPEQGLNLISGEHYDVILLDRNLGKNKAENIISQIHTIAPGVPVVILTGDSECQEGFLNKIGASGVVFKPFQMSDLIEGIAGFL